MATKTAKKGAAKRTGDKLNTARPRAYGKYTYVKDGDLYAVVKLPLGNGKYQRKTKRIEDAVKARQWAADQLLKHREGNAPPDAKEKRLTFTVFADWYKSEFLFAPIYQNGKKLDGLRMWEKERQKLDRLTRYFGMYQLNNISVDVLRRYKRDRLLGKIEGLKKPVSITSVNRDFAALRKMFGEAVRRKWMSENPFSLDDSLFDIAAESPDNQKVTPRIARRLLARARKSEQALLFPLIAIMRYTGARPSEVFPYEAKKGDDVPREPLTWRSVLDFDFKAVRLVSFKGRKANRNERLVPCSIQLERILRDLYAKTQNPKFDDLLFPLASVKRSWSTLCRSIRVKGVVLRDFRAFFNQELINRRFDEASRLLIMGHTSIATNVRYSKIDPEFVQRYREAFNIQDAGAAVN